MPNSAPPVQPPSDGAAPALPGEIDDDTAANPIDPRQQLKLEEEVKTWALENRHVFPNRRDFNIAICDRLAARGIAPLAGVLRRLGGRGTSTSQAEDVRQWFAALAARFNLPQAQIPLGARRQANTLFEQLWLAAKHEIDQGVAAPLRAELASAQEALAAASDRSQQLEKALAAEQERAGGLASELQASQELARDAAERAAGELQALRATLETTKREHAQAIDQANSERERLRASLDAEIRQLHDRNEHLVRTSADERARLLQQVDQERQAAREWQTRHDAVHNKREQLQGRVEALLESETRAVAARDSALEQVEALQGRITEAQSAEREALATAGEWRERAAGSEGRVTQLQSRVQELERQLAAATTPKKADVKGKK
ncbi:MAG: hypothetical protein K0Q43_22 [Ramlibacter sp.]|jgi:predicted  nucleic acid-binding Zn-ribbon protein|nr:hypothetical protein [Ramlibacter sp.]